MRRVLDALPSEVARAERDEAPIERDGQARLWWRARAVVEWAVLPYAAAMAARTAVEPVAAIGPDQRRPRLVTHLAVVAVLALAAASCSSGDKPVASSTTSVGAAHLRPGTEATPARPSSGCRAPTQQPRVLAQHRAVRVGSSYRDYLLSAPGPTSKPVPRPVVVDFHALGESAVSEEKLTRFGDLGLSDGFVVVQPRGVGSLPQWQYLTDPSRSGDVLFIRAILRRLESQRCIDEARVYATGISDGGFMASYVGCNMAGTFAAVAPVAGVLHLPTCRPSRPVPILSIHGTADPILYFNGGIAKPSSGAWAPPVTTRPPQLDGAGRPDAVKQWAKTDGCSLVPIDVRVFPQVVHRVYRCPAGVAVEFYIVMGGGHAWPGSALSRSLAAQIGFTTFDLDATSLIWSFFKRFALPAA